MKVKKIIFNILTPNLPLYGALLVIQSIQLFISYQLIDHIGIGLIMGTIAWAYILALPQNFICHKILRGIYAGVLIVISSLFGLLELFCAEKLEELLGAGHILVIADSNLGESIEFIETFIDLEFTLVAVGVAVITISVYQLMRRVKFSLIREFLTVISLFSLIVTGYFGIWSDCGIGRAVDSMIESFKYTPNNLQDSQPEFDVCEICTLHPNIILIIGESFDKKHSSLYGYGKDTNPLLSKRQRDSSMIVFTSVQSAAPCTNLSIRQALSLSESYDDNLWYKKPILPTTMRKSGYKTLWLSNQCPTSLYDRNFSDLAGLCDSVTYAKNGDLRHNKFRKSFDQVLFLPFKRYVDEADWIDRNFCVVHLMGSHFRYDLRYPKTFAKFIGSDYADQPEQRRETFAYYDNSILYNDFVVDSLMSIADNLNAVIIYMPDHGQDFYYTRDIAAHGRVEDAASFEAGCQIPFMIYFTKSFRENHPEIVEHTRSLSQKKFNTKYLMNTIMDMAGYDICGYEVMENSLFDGAFGSKEVRIN